jgi:hypothetical protein
LTYAEQVADSWRLQNQSHMKNVISDTSYRTFIHKSVLEYLVTRLVANYKKILALGIGHGGGRRSANKAGYSIVSWVVKLAWFIKI